MVWEITYLRLYKRNILTLDQAVARTGNWGVSREGPGGITKAARYIEQVGHKLCRLYPPIIRYL